MLKIINCNNENYRNKLKKYLDTNEKISQIDFNSVSKIIKNVKREEIKVF